MRRFLFCALILSALLGALGCGSGSPGEGSSAPAGEPFPIVDVTTPTMSFEEFRLPQSVVIEDYDARYAVGIDTWANSGGGAVVLLDMDGGAHATVLPEPLGLAEGFVTITARCSDSWVAWEEYRGDEQGDPWGVEWRLYAAWISPDGLTIGEPVMAATSVSSIRSRPLFRVAGDRLYWMTNSSPNPEQEGAVTGGHVQELDLLTGEQREVFDSGRNAHTFCVQGDELVVSTYPQTGEGGEEVLVLGLDDGEERFSAALLNTGAEVSHWPAYDDGDLLWGELPRGSQAPPRLQWRMESGERILLAEAGSDPAFVGPYVVYESFTTGAPAGLTWPTITALHRGRGERFVIARSSGSVSDVAWMMLPGRPRSASVLVVTGSVWGDEGEDTTGTWVRRYHL